MHVRPATQADIPDISRVHVDAWRTAYRGIIPDAFLDTLSYPKHEERHHRYMAKPDTLYFIAETPADGIIGFLMGGRERTGDPHHAGEIYAIYLLHEHRRRGTGSALVAQWANALRGAGMNSAMVWVLADNTSAVRFYQRTGASYLREQPIEIGGVSLKEHAYGWDDLSAVASAPSNTANRTVPPSL